MNLEFIIPSKESYAEVPKSRRKEIKAWLQPGRVEAITGVYRRRNMQAFFEICSKNYKDIYPIEMEYNYFFHKLLKKVDPKQFDTKKKSTKSCMDSSADQTHLLKIQINHITRIVEKKLLDMQAKKELIQAANTEKQISEYKKMIINLILIKLSESLKEYIKGNENIIVDIAEKEINTWWENCCSPTTQMSPVVQQKNERDSFVGPLEYYEIPKASRNIREKRDELRAIAETLAADLEKVIKNPPQFETNLEMNSQYKKHMPMIKDHPQREFLVFRTSVFLKLKFPQKANRDLQKYVILFGTEEIVKRTEEESTHVAAIVSDSLTPLLMSSSWSSQLFDLKSQDIKEIHLLNS